MSKRNRAVLGFLGFFAVAGIMMSDRFQNISDAIPESVYYYFFISLLVGMTTIGFYSWWRHYNARKPHPTLNRLKKLLETPSWWNWPF